MISDLLLLGIGFALIIKGGGWFVSSSVRISECFNVPRIVIGTTLMSLATTMPELVVSVISGLRGASGLAVGNAVGSCLCNMCLILGLMAWINRITVHPAHLRIPMAAMVAFGVLLLVISWNLRISRWSGGLLVGLGLVYFFFDFLVHTRGVHPVELTEARKIESEAITGHPWLVTRKGTAAVFLMGALMVVLGSRLLVGAAVEIAKGLGVPSIVIGLTIVALGTSLPEMVTAITSSRQNVSDLGVGNILGANVANLTVVVGGAASIHEMTMARSTQLFNFPALLIGMLLVLWAIVTRRTMSKLEGSVLLGYYVLYVGLLGLMAWQNR